MEDLVKNSFALYSTVQYKNFPSALFAFFEKECPHIGGSAVRKTLVDLICRMVGEFFPETSHLRPGQTPWVTVDVKEKGNYGKSIKDTKLVPVTLDLIKDGELRERAEGKKVSDIKRETAVRLCRQAYSQGGCLTLAEVAVLMKSSVTTASKYIWEYEAKTGEVVPYRGTIHDIGPTLTHKRIIIQKLFIEQQTVQQVMRETCHSCRAIERYITSFKQILLCHKKGMPVEEIAFAVHKTPRLVSEYMAIVNEYKDNGYIIDKLMDFEVNQLTAGEIYEPYYNAKN